MSRPYRAIRAPSRQVYQSPGRQRLGNWPCVDDTGAVSVFDFTVGTSGGTNTYSTNAVTAWNSTANQEPYHRPVQSMYMEGNDDADADRATLFIYPGLLYTPTRLKRGIWNLQIDVVSGSWDVIFSLAGNESPHSYAGYYPDLEQYAVPPFRHYYPYPLSLSGAGSETLMDYRVWQKCMSFAIGLAGNTGEARLRGYRRGETPNF